jgi:outer membrane lipoprotein-sorting protein
MFRLLRVAAVLCSFAVLGACSTAADAGSSFGDSELINDVAARLATAETVSYTATYTLTDNSQISVTHSPDPSTTAFRSRDDMVLLTPDNATSCKIAAKPSTCTATAGSTAETTLPAIDHTIETDGMIRPETVIAKLTQMSLNADAILYENDRTVAGTGETCVSINGVPQADRFTACVTTDGLLGAFTGSIDGIAIDVQLVQFTLSTDATAFALPGPS